MGLKFCRNCGNILKVLKKDGKVFLKCENCRIFAEATKFEDLMIKEIIKRKEKGKGVVKGKNPMATFPHKCSKCGYEKAEVIDMGIKVSDEDPLILYKCGKCGHVEREAGKVM